MLIKGTEELIKGTEELNFKHLRYRITRKPGLTISWAFLYRLSRPEIGLQDRDLLWKPQLTSAPNAHSAITH